MNCSNALGKGYPQSDGNFHKRFSPVGISVTPPRSEISSALTSRFVKYSLTIESSTEPKGLSISDPFTRMRCV